LNKKRVWCLYRVSTKKQIDTEDDIPMQRTACHNYVANKPEWEITSELYEKGISGWKTKVDDRDALNEIKEAAIQSKFDILLVFMLDRLGRREDESPLVVSFLHEHDIEVWSVQEGKRSVESHVDKLITYIGFWQSSGESLKTSMRVRESKKILSEQGYYQGGVPPYGYKVFETDQRHWKNKDRFLKELVPDEYESKIVKLIFEWYVNHHLGYRKIVDKLNNEGYKTRDGKPWRVNIVQRAIINPICIGLVRYKSFDDELEFQPYNEKLRIILDEVYYKAEEIRIKRKDSLHDQDKEGIPLAGKLMVSGLAYCGYCGNKLSGNYLYRKNQKPHNRDEYYINKVYRYRCPLNIGKIHHEQNMFGAKKYDKKTIEQIKDVLSLIDIEKFIDVNINKKKDELELKNKALSDIQKDKGNFEKQLVKLNGEIANSLLGNSAFTPEQLSGAINTLNEQIKNVDEKIEKIKIEIEREKDNNYDINTVANELENWSEKFDAADDDLKKAMLSRIVERVEFKKEDVNIHFNLIVEDLIKQSMGIEEVVK
jgi:DNA invertase Pin-like site-specific DNA recombinase